MNQDCIFCKIISGEVPSYKIWESETHLAFLGIFPSTKGMTVVVPKKHLPSYVFELNEENYAGLMGAAREVGLLLDKKLGAERTFLLTEGLEVDHAHVKLYPFYGGFPDRDMLHDGKRASDEELEEVKEIIVSK